MPRKTHTVWRSDGKILAYIYQDGSTLGEMHANKMGTYKMLDLKGGKQVPVLVLSDHYNVSVGRITLPLYPGDMIGEAP